MKNKNYICVSDAIFDEINALQAKMSEGTYAKYSKASVIALAVEQMLRGKEDADYKACSQCSQ